MTPNAKTANIAPSAIPKTTPQRTIANTVRAHGIGLHSGESVHLALVPAPVGTGIVFYRTDLARTMPLHYAHIADTALSSNLCDGVARIGTIEHLLSALCAYGIDNVRIELDGAEVPIFDGSAAPFCALIKKAGVVAQDLPKHFVQILRCVEVVDGDKYARFLPSERTHYQFGIDFTHPFIQNTPNLLAYTFDAHYEDQIAPARTFGFLHDVQALQAQGLCRGAGYDNAIVLDDRGVINGNLRYPDEFVRHKLLDAIGDLYACQMCFIGDFVAYKSGHKLNNQLLRALFLHEDNYKIVTNYEIDLPNCTKNIERLGKDLPKDIL